MSSAATPNLAGAATTNTVPIQQKSAVGASPPVSSSNPATKSRPSHCIRLRIACVTHNIGSIECSGDTVPEAVQTLTESWIGGIARLLTALEQSAPAPTPSGGEGPGAEAPAGPLDIVVMHLQEIGGKKFSASFNAYLSSRVPACYPSAAWCSGLLMETSEDEALFTAIGTVIFVSPRVKDFTSILSVRHRTFVPIQDNPLSMVESARSLFHGAKFSNAEKSRKGFLLTSLRVGFKTLNFLNIHSYHDADNAAAASSSPSPYAKKRLDSFKEALSEVLPVIHRDDPLFLFGDFNMRLDAKRVLQHAKEELHLDVEFGKKEVKASNYFWEYLDTFEHHETLELFDGEELPVMEAIAAVSGIEFTELPRRFGFTYMRGAAGSTTSPAGVEISGGSAKRRPLKRERLPAWCDRVWLNPAALCLLTADGTVAAGNRTKAPNCAYTSYTPEPSLDHDAVYLLSSVLVSP